MGLNALGSRPWEIRGILCLAGGLFLLLCLASYSPQDPSLTHFVPDDGKVGNLIGSFGAYTSDILIRLLGFSAYLVPVALFMCAFRFFLNPAFAITRVSSLGFATLVFSVSGLLALTLGSISFHNAPLRSGGLLGAGLQFVLGYYFNPVGSFLIILFLLLLALIMTVDLSVVALVKAMASGTSAVSSLLRSRFARDNADVPAISDTPEPDFREDIPLIAPPPAPKKPKAEKPGKRDVQLPFDFVDAVTGAYRIPPLTLLDPAEKKDAKTRRDSLINNSRILEKTLADFGVDVKVAEVRPGPVITMYELEPAPGVKINKITTLADDLALALKASAVRIVAPIPGKAAVGIEIPNGDREAVPLREVLDHDTFLESHSKLPIALGVDIVGTPVIADLIRMPHLLIAGTTGSGKSVGLNAMICSILFRAAPEEVKFLMIDPKRLELSSYEGIPHLLHPVVVDPKKASQVLRWAVEEMERRYKTIGEHNVKGIDAYNKLAEKDAKIARLPYIVIIIDELADLMMVAQRNVEESLARLAQMARASGIHLILATQRPSVDVITGVIKANFPTRISFQVSSKVDSRTILDQLGAEALLGAGDMLFMPPGTSRLTRIHGAFVSDREIAAVVDFIKQQGMPAYDDSITSEVEEARDGASDDGDFDEKYDEAVQIVTDLGQASISLVQRYLKVGYNRAARIIERMEQEGVVGPSDGVKPRKVLVRKMPNA